MRGLQILFGILRISTIMLNMWKMFKNLKYLTTLLVLTQFFIITFPVQSTYGLDAKDTYNSYINSGKSKLSLQDYRGAIQDYNKAIELNPNYADAYRNRGISKERLGDYRGAIQDFNKAIELNPKDEFAFMGRGVAKIFLGQNDDGCLDLSKAEELGSSLAHNLIKAFCN